MATEREHQEGTDGLTTIRRTYDSCAIRAKDAAHAPDPDNHRMWFRLSTPELWDDGLVLEPKAFKKHIKRYMVNPVVSDSHEYAPLVERLLGKMVDIEFDDIGPLGQVEFAVGTPNGQWADYLYFNRFANAGSVGFSILKTNRDTTEEGREFMRVPEGVLKEFGLVMLPMDEGALAQHERGDVLIRALHKITDSEAEGIKEAPDRIAEVLEELRAIRVRLDGLIRAGGVTDARTTVVLEPKPETHTEIPIWRQQFDALAAIHSDLTGEELLDKLRTVKHVLADT